MQGKEIYYSTDFTKFIVDKVISEDAETTYIGECPYQRSEFTPGSGYSTKTDEYEPIRRVRKVIEYSDGKMETYYPDADNSMRFKWSDRYVLNYI